MSPVDRVFLDANILFSAAYLPESRLGELWSLPKVELVTSEFALEEARRNLLAYQPEAVPLLEQLRAGITITTEAALPLTLPDPELPEKDQPILAAALAAGCTHLLTGDARHFGHLYGHTIAGVLVLTPAQYFRKLQARRRRGRR